MPRVPEIRLRTFAESQVNSAGDYVLYWMTAFRRIEANFALQRAVEWCEELRKPLVIFEALRCGYRWASDRIHAFVIQGMADNARRLAGRRVCYFPYLEPAPGEGQGLLEALSRPACVVVGDDFPCFFLPRMVASARRQIPVRFELVDSNGLLPLRATDRVFNRAFDFRRFLQGHLLPHLAEIPEPDPLAKVKLTKPAGLPSGVEERWPAADLPALMADDGGLAERLRKFPIDHDVPIAPMVGGSAAAQQTLQDFISRKLQYYADRRNQPEEDVASGLSPYLHFGHIAAHQVFDATMTRERWQPGKIAAKASGSSEGWWGASREAESFLDELITWREVGYNMCVHREDYDQYSSLPDWCHKTLNAHARDRREHTYTLEEFAAAETHDELWNAAQRQLLREGRIHNYLRMLWGKKILEWSSSPQEALRIMIELNNKYAVDGRNPNSYSGIFWVLGRYDRPWAPERPIFGQIRYMSSENTARKLKVKNYLRTWSR